MKTAFRVVIASRWEREGELEGAPRGSFRNVSRQLL